MDLSGSSLYCTPPSLCFRTELIELDLSCNPIKEYFTEEMTQLTNLQILNLRRCDLTNIPFALSKMNQLIKLDISENNIGISYLGLTNLTNLEELNLKLTGITTIENFESFIKLKVLDVSKNNLRYDSISGIENLISLETLIMRECNLHQFVINTEKLIHLEHIDVNFNQILSLGNIVNIHSLKKLYVDTKIQNINMLSNLEDLELGKLLWEDIPESLVELKHLKKLKIMGNIGVLQPVLFKFENLQELSFHSNCIFTYSDLFGCTVLKLTEEEFDIRCLFPHLSEDIVESIKLKEVSSLYPDLSCIKTLNKVKYYISSIRYEINVSKMDDKWIYKSSRLEEPPKDISYEFESVFNPLCMGRNGIFIFIPVSLLKLCNEENNISIVKHFGSTLYVIDCNNILHKTTYSYRSNLIEVLPNITNIGRLRLHNKFRDGEPLFISEEGDVYLYTNLKLKGYKFTQIFGNNVISFGIDIDGKLMEIYYFNDTENVKYIDNLPSMKCGMVICHTYRNTTYHAICIDESGCIWMRDFTQYATPEDGKTWKLVELPFTFVNILCSHNQVIFLTIQGEILISPYSNVIDSFLSNTLTSLPVFCNLPRFSSKKSARK